MIKVKVTPEATYPDWMDDLVEQAVYFNCGLSKETEYDGPFAEMCFKTKEEADKYVTMIQKFYGHETGIIEA